MYWVEFTNAKTTHLHHLFNISLFVKTLSQSLLRLVEQCVVIYEEQGRKTRYVSTYSVRLEASVQYQSNEDLGVVFGPCCREVDFKQPIAISYPEYQFLAFDVTDISDLPVSNQAPKRNFSAKILRLICCVNRASFTRIGGLHCMTWSRFLDRAINLWLDRISACMKNSRWHISS